MFFSFKKKIKKKHYKNMNQNLCIYLDSVQKKHIIRNVTLSRSIITDNEYGTFYHVYTYMYVL